MTFCVETETDISALPEDLEGLLKKVAETVLDMEECPYEAAVNLLITDDEGIREINREQRGIDSATDVLSFPAFDYEKPADFSALEDETAIYAFDPDSGELLLGDIVISAQRAILQAETFGHTIYREIAFLIAHSMLHLIGYDHMEGDEEKVMFEKQEKALLKLGINREEL